MCKRIFIRNIITPGVQGVLVHIFPIFLWFLTNFTSFSRLKELVKHVLQKGPQGISDLHVAHTAAATDMRGPSVRGITSQNRPAAFDPPIPRRRRDSGEGMGTRSKRASRRVRFTPWFRESAAGGWLAALDKRLTTKLRCYTIDQIICTCQ